MLNLLKLKAEMKNHFPEVSILILQAGEKSDGQQYDQI